MRTGVGILSLVALWLCASAMSTTAMADVPAAQLDLVQGKILVNQGQGFVAPVHYVSLQFGDKVFVGQHSSVSIHYIAVGCAVTYAAPAVVTILEKVPCKVGQTLGMVDSVFVQPAGAAILAAPAVSPAMVGLGYSGAVASSAAADAIVQALQPVSAP
jgi:hypothetical protein